MIQNVIMNKYIKTDIETGLSYLRLGIMNALSAIEEGEVTEITLGEHVPFSLVVNCAIHRGWIAEDELDYDGWEINCVYFMVTPTNKHAIIESCLWDGLPTKILIDNDISSE